MVLRNAFLLFIVSIAVLYGCETLKSSKPIGPIKEYERLLAGRFDADYIGTDNCLSACHEHDKIRRDLDASTMGAQLSKSSGLPLVNCESCHGPGSLAVAGLTPAKVAEDLKAGKQTSCDYKTLLDLCTSDKEKADMNNIPPQAKSLICLKCHTANATFNLHNWNAGAHSVNDVSCSDCHNIHKGPDMIVRNSEMADMCEKCHQEIKAEFSLPSHHPVPEKKIFCNNCHNPHGSGNEKSLVKSSVKQTCTKCHAEKEGPFVFEHADNTEDCLSCHKAHGSVNNNLLTVSLPFLCLQCHSVHRTSSASSAESKGAFNTRCTDCHSQIHGTDLPSVSGNGRFTH
jgi:DmsE family decaheme c-type cytochrome